MKTIDNKLKNIDNDLMDKRWTGYSNEKCRDINNLLKEYNTSIESLIGRISKAVINLENSAQNYDSKANRI
jgi:flagellar biosynthesis chaperone FliJ